MTTRIKIENVNGPDIVLVRNGNDRVTAVLPGEDIELYVCYDYTISVNEAELQAPPLDALV